jgi:hypothetical protein
MDLTKIIDELRGEKERLERVIAALENVQSPATGAAPQKNAAAENQCRLKTVGKSQRE